MAYHGTMNTTISFKIATVACLMFLLVGAYFGHKAYPGIKVHETIKTQTEVQDHIVTQTKTVYLKDGTKQIDVVKTEDKETEKQANTEIVKPDPVNSITRKWHLMGGIGVDNSLQRFYSLGLQRRVVGPVFVGVQADTRQTIGLTLAIEF